MHKRKLQSYLTYNVAVPRTTERDLAAGTYRNHRSPLLPRHDLSVPPSVLRHSIWLDAVDRVLASPLPPT